MKLTAITEDGVKAVIVPDDFVSFELPKTWNEGEVRERLEGQKFIIARDYTEETKEGSQYYPAKVYVPAESAASAEEALKAPYEKTQEDYIEETLIPSYVQKLIERVATLESKVKQLEGGK